MHTRQLKVKLEKGQEPFRSVADNDKVVDSIVSLVDAIIKRERQS